MLSRVLYSLLDEQARMIALDSIVLVIGTRGQYRVNKKVFARLRDSGWIEVYQQSNDLVEYLLTRSGKEVAKRMKDYSDQFMQLTLWEAEKAKQEQQLLLLEEHTT
jgi:hypothetical protein